jgi:hypothetical protein
MTTSRRCAGARLWQGIADREAAALALADMRVIAKEPYRIVPEGVAVEPRPAQR